MPTKIRPLHDRVIVKRTGEIEKTKAGIIIPDTAKGEAARRQGRGSGPREVRGREGNPLGRQRRRQDTFRELFRC
jgi:chaperonin GroES